MRPDKENVNQMSEIAFRFLGAFIQGFRVPFLLKLLGGKLAPKPVYFVLRKELLNL